GSDRWGTTATSASGRATTATAPRLTASPMKSSPSNTAPLNAPKTLPRATLRWSIAKPVTSESESMSARSRRRTESLLLRFVNEGQNLAHIGFAAHVRGDDEHRRDPADGAADHRRDVPPGRGETVRVLGRLGLVEHDDDHIARVIHREHTREARDVDGLAVAAVDQLLRGAGLATDTVAGRIGFAAGALHHHQAEDGAHPVARVLAEHAAPRGQRMVPTALEDRRRIIDAAVEQGRIAHRELQRRDGDALTETDRHRLER